MCPLLGRRLRRAGAVVAVALVHAAVHGAPRIRRGADRDRPLEYRRYPRLVLAAYPEAYRVRLDAGTGVCVSTEDTGGLSPGRVHDLRIEAVDEAMADDLFVHRARGVFRRRQ